MRGVNNMPKIKTHSGAKKRFKVSKTGKIKRAHVGRRHILTKKSTKRLRHLRKEGFAKEPLQGGWLCRA